MRKEQPWHKTALLLLRGDVLSHQEIADLCGTTRNCVAHFARQNGIKGQPGKKKPVSIYFKNCLCCGRKFRSEGRGNWICYGCKKSEEYQAGIDCFSVMR